MVGAAGGRGAGWESWLRMRRGRLGTSEAGAGEGGSAVEVGVPAGSWVLLVLVGVPAEGAGALPLLSSPAPLAEELRDENSAFIIWPWGSDSGFEALDYRLSIRIRSHARGSIIFGV